jgi:hypothetical protein
MCAGWPPGRQNGNPGLRLYHREEVPTTSRAHEISDTADSRELHGLIRVFRPANSARNLANMLSVALCSISFR